MVPRRQIKVDVQRLFCGEDVETGALKRVGIARSFQKTTAPSLCVRKAVTLAELEFPVW